MAQTSVLTSSNYGWTQNTENGFFRPKGGKHKTNLHLFRMRGQSIYNFLSTLGLEFGWLWGCGEKENYLTVSSALI